VLRGDPFAGVDRELGGLNLDLALGMPHAVGNPDHLIRETLGRRLTRAYCGARDGLFRQPATDRGLARQIVSAADIDEVLAARNPLADHGDHFVRIEI